MCIFEAREARDEEAMEPLRPSAKPLRAALTACGEAKYSPPGVEQWSVFDALIEWHAERYIKRPPTELVRA
jgi:hypothetical protein